MTYCVICGADNIEPLITLPAMPTHCNVLWTTHNEAVNAPRGDIQLVFCPTCGHIFNAAFQPELMAYTQAYENSLHFSPRFQSYAESLATHLIERYQLYDKDIIEIGAGQGDFLAMLCQQGRNRGVGFDPSYRPDLYNQETSAELEFIKDYYSQDYAHYRADLIVCRHVLEHIPNPVAFLSTIRQAVGDNKTALFFEVPNALSTLRDLAIWDIIYEHCAYFTADSLNYLFTRCGFTLTSLSEAYAGQFLCLEATSQPEEGFLLSEKTPTKITQPFGSAQGKYVLDFVDNYKNRLQHWQTQLDQVAKLGQKIVIWGAGSKGVTFLNLLDTQNIIEFAVDINPRKRDKYIPCTGQQIVFPEFLKSYRPNVVIAMNPIYKDEIRSLLHNLGLTTVTILSATHFPKRNE